VDKPIYYEIVWRSKLFYVYIPLMTVILYVTASIYVLLAIVLTPIFIFLALYTLFTSFYRVELYRDRIKVYYIIGAREVINLNEIKEVYVNPPFLKVESPFTINGKLTISIITVNNRKTIFASNSPQLIIQLIMMLRSDLRKSYTREIIKLVT